MQDVSEKYRRIASSGEYRSETKVVIDGHEYGENKLFRVLKRTSVFADEPSAGNVISGEIELTMDQPTIEVPRRAEIRPYVRIFNSSEESEWIPKGVFFVSERDKNEGNSTIYFHGYDSLRKADAEYPSSALEWPAKESDVLMEIAENIGVQIDKRVWDIIPEEGKYQIQLPTGYTMREILGYIAGMYGSNVVMSDEGKLMLIAIYGLPEETNLLITESGDYITFGGTRILLRSVNNG